MSDQFELRAEVREDLGKGASRRLRHFDGRVPGIIYGGDKAPQPLSLIRKDLEKALENLVRLSSATNDDSAYLAINFSPLQF